MRTIAPKRTRRVVITGLMAMVAVLWSGTAVASASEASCTDGAFSFGSRSTQVNRVVIVYSPGALTVSDIVPIRNDGGLVYPNAADRRTVRCQAPSFDLGVSLGPGNDTLTVRYVGQTANCRDAHLNRFYDGPGNDTLMVGTGANVWFNGPGNDTYRGSCSHDLARPGLGNDRIFGGAGNDVLFGGPGNDLLFGGLGLDRIFGGPGVDRIDGVIRDVRRG